MDLVLLSSPFSVSTTSPTFTTFTGCVVAVVAVLIVVVGWQLEGILYYSSDGEQKGTIYSMEAPRVSRH